MALPSALSQQAEADDQNTMWPFRALTHVLPGLLTNPKAKAPHAPPHTIAFQLLKLCFQEGGCCAVHSDGFFAELEACASELKEVIDFFTAGWDSGIRRLKVAGNPHFEVVEDNAAFEDWMPFWYNFLTTAVPSCNRVPSRVRGFVGCFWQGESGKEPTKTNHPFWSDAFFGFYRDQLTASKEFLDTRSASGPAGTKTPYSEKSGDLRPTRGPLTFLENREVGDLLDQISKNPSGDVDALRDRVRTTIRDRRARIQSPTTTTTQSPTSAYAVGGSLATEADIKAAVEQHVHEKRLVAVYDRIAKLCGVVLSMQLPVDLAKALFALTSQHPNTQSALEDNNQVSTWSIKLMHLCIALKYDLADKGQVYNAEEPEKRQSLCESDKTGELVVRIDGSVVKYLMILFRVRHAAFLQHFLKDRSKNEACLNQAFRTTTENRGTKLDAAIGFAKNCTAVTSATRAHSGTSAPMNQLQMNGAAGGPINSHAAVLAVHSFGIRATCQKYADELFLGGLGDLLQIASQLPDADDSELMAAAKQSKALNNGVFSWVGRWCTADEHHACVQTEIERIKKALSFYETTNAKVKVYYDAEKREMRRLRSAVEGRHQNVDDQDAVNASIKANHVGPVDERARKNVAPLKTSAVAAFSTNWVAREEHVHSLRAWLEQLVGHAAEPTAAVQVDLLTESTAERSELVSLKKTHEADPTCHTFEDFKELNPNTPLLESFKNCKRVFPELPKAMRIAMANEIEAAFRYCLQWIPGDNRRYVGTSGLLKLCSIAASHGLMDIVSDSERFEDFKAGKPTGQLVAVVALQQSDDLKEIALAPVSELIVLSNLSDHWKCFVSMAVVAREICSFSSVAIAFPSRHALFDVNKSLVRYQNGTLSFDYKGPLPILTVQPLGGEPALLGTMLEFYPPNHDWSPLTYKFANYAQIREVLFWGDAVARECFGLGGGACSTKREHPELKPLKSFERLACQLIEKANRVVSRPEVADERVPARPSCDRP